MVNKSTVPCFQVYLITNLVNGKMYVGKCCRGVSRRWGVHLSASGTGMVITKAIKKYGAKSFALRVLYEGVNNEEIIRVERAMIAQYDTFSPRGYNLTIGGEGVMGRKMSEETKAKKSKIATAWQTGRTLSATHLEAMRIASSGRVFSAESRKKKSASLKRWYAAHPKAKTAKSRPKLNRSIICITTGDLFPTWGAADIFNGVSIGSTRKHMDKYGVSHGKIFKPLQAIAYERPWL